MEGKPQVKKRYYTRIMDFYRFNPVYVPGFNTAVRALLGRRARGHYREVKGMASGREEEIAAWYGRHRFFFGFGMYRSGTTFLADFLNSQIPSAIVLHEANVNDYWHYARASRRPEEAKSYIEEYRLNEIFFRISPYDFSTYGEINPFLRLHCGAIKAALPHAPLFQVVRHPAKVIRSLMSREQLGWKDPMRPLIGPSADDPHLKDWPRWGRFEKFCWMWARDNRLLRETTGHWIRFEDFRKDYGYFRERLLDHIGLDMDADTWQRAMGATGRNATPSYSFPEYSAWTADQKRFFEDMCGPEMAFYGY